MKVLRYVGNKSVKKKKGRPGQKGWTGIAWSLE
jgi:hypothetical protein